MTKRIACNGGYYVVSDNSIIDSGIDIKKHASIKQSNLIIDMQYAYNRIQFLALLHIMDTMDPILTYNLKNRSAVITNTKNVLWNKDTKTVEVRLPLNLFEHKANHYNELREALKDMTNVDVVYPEWSGLSSKSLKVYAKLCAVAFNPDPTDKRKEMVHFFFKEEVALILIDPYKGFTKLLRETLKHTKSVYTAKIYMLICRYADKNKWVISYKALRKLLCVNDKFTRYADFRERILKTSENELKGASNHWFDLVEMFKYKNSKDPELLIFNIFSMNCQAKDIEDITLIKRRIYEMAVTHFKVKPVAIKSILNKILPRTASYTNKKHADLVCYIASHRNEIGDTTKYYITSLRNIIDTEQFTQTVVQQQLPL